MRCTRSRKEQACLVVVGSSGRGRIGRVLPGSTAERMLHGGPCRRALAPHGYVRAPLETIAVGFVDSPEGHAAPGAAHRLAARTGARLRVIAAVHPSSAFDAATAAGTPSRRGVALEGHHRAAAEAALGRAIDALPAGVDIEFEVHVDDPADVLVRVSEHADLLVCGSRGYGPVRSVLLGGVSRRLVNGAGCPVLVLAREPQHPLESALGEVRPASPPGADRRLAPGGPPGARRWARARLPGGHRRAVGEGFGDRLVRDLAVSDVEAPREAGASASAASTPTLAPQRTYGNVALVSARVAVTGTAPGMFATQ